MESDPTRDPAMNAVKRLCLVVEFGLLAAGTAIAADTTPTKFARIDLLDGRTLKNVELVSYDAATDKVLLVADQKAMLVPVNLIPAPFAARFKHDLPESGATSSIVANGAAVAPRPSHATPAMQPVVNPRPTIVVPAPANAGIAGGGQTLARHKQVAEARAARYYRFEYKAGSDSIMVTGLQIETDQPELIEGWPERYRTQGRAFLEFYDSKGGSFSRATSRFEVLTEQKPGKPLTVVEFIPK
jgi:hypothetical protein